MTVYKTPMDLKNFISSLRHFKYNRDNGKLGLGFNIHKIVNNSFLSPIFWVIKAWWITFKSDCKPKTHTNLSLSSFIDFSFNKLVRKSVSSYFKKYDLYL